MTAAPLDVPALAGAVKALPAKEQSRLFDILASEDATFREYMEWTPWETVKARCDAIHHHAE